MRKTSQRKLHSDELLLAIGLAWGHLKLDQFLQAHQLILGCLYIWPDSAELKMMQAFAKVESGEELSEDLWNHLQEFGCDEWTHLVKRRANMTRHLSTESQG